MYEFDKDELQELRDCKLIQRLNKRHRKIVEWQIKQYLDIKSISNEEFLIKAFTIKGSKSEPINFKEQHNHVVNRRRLENLNNLDFNFGLYFYMENYMPFFTDQDVGLFKTAAEPENGDMCLIKIKVLESYWLAFKEENGFFDLEGNFLDDGEKVEVIGVLVNIETR